MKAESTERKRWLETLLDRMSAPAAVMRQHLGEVDQNHTLGSAAEAGVRDLLRLVLPQRLTVASGFVREPGRTLAGITPAAAVSSQTDVIIYDGTTATPLLSLGEVQIVAAPDVLGVIEVKDRDKGSEELGKPEPKAKASKQTTPKSTKPIKREDDGALIHTARLATLAPNAFRAIVLFRGKESKKGKAQEEEDDDELEDEELEVEVAHDNESAKGIAKKKPGRPRIAEIKRAQERIRWARLGQDELPHLIYCASYEIPDDDGQSYEGSYLAFHDFFAQTVQIHEYHRDPTRALASFLRIMTGFFAVRGMISPSLHLDLLPTQPDQVEIVKDDVPPFQCLHGELLKLRNPPNEFKPFYSLFVEYLRKADNAVSKLVTGRDAMGLPTAGIAICVDMTTQRDQAPIKTTAVAFFYLSAPNVYVCTNGSDKEGERWIIEDETIDEYRRRALRESGQGERSDNVAPGKRLEAEIEESEA